MFAILLVIEKLWLLKHLKKRKLLSHIYVLLLVTVSFVIFDAASTTEAFSCIAAMFGGQNLPLVTSESVYFLRSYLIILIVAIIGATPLPKKLAAAEKGRRTALAYNIAEPILLMLLLTVCTAFLIDGSFNPFLYFRFKEDRYVCKAQKYFPYRDDSRLFARFFAVGNSEARRSGICKRTQTACLLPGDQAVDGIFGIVYEGF